MRKHLVILITLIIVIAAGSSLYFFPSSGDHGSDIEEPTLEEDRAFFENKISSILDDNYSLVKVGKTVKDPGHEWQEEPTGAYAIFRQGADTYFFWYENIRNRKVENKVVKPQDNHERMVIRELYEEPLNITPHKNSVDIAVTKVVDLKKRSYSKMFGDNIWTENEGRYAVEYAGPPNYGFYHDGPPIAFEAMLIGENAKILKRGQIAAIM